MPRKHWLAQGGLGRPGKEGEREGASVPREHWLAQGCLGRPGKKEKRTIS